MSNKVKIYLIVIVIGAMISGCATSNFSYGKDFDSTKAAAIEKNKTTQDEILKMFGQPQYKTVISSTEEKWLYSFSQGTASAQQGFASMQTQVTGKTKTLDVLFKDGIVTNFSYNEGPLEQKSQW